MHTITHNLSREDILHVMQEIYSLRMLIGYAYLDYFGTIWCEQLTDALFINDYLKRKGIKRQTHLDVTN